MYCRLQDGFSLRGYQLWPYALVKRPWNGIQFLDGETFRALNLCNGGVDIGQPFVSDRSRDIIQYFIEMGAVSVCEYGDRLHEDQRYRFYDNRFIHTAHWSITGKCNYHCKHCYMSAPEAKLGELPHEQMMNIIRQIGDCGVLSVSLTGGEPLIRKDFEDIVAELSHRHISISQIYTNGRLVTSKLDMLDRYDCKPEFSMSYDGDEGWHDWLRGMPNASKYVLDAFDLCHVREFPTSSEMCLHRGNLGLLRQSINTLAAHHCASCKTNPIMDTDFWRRYGEEYTITMEELFEAYLAYIPDFYADGMPLTLMLGGFFLCEKDDARGWSIPLLKSEREDQGRLRQAVCTHARNTLYISPEGRMLPCLSLSAYDVQYDYPLISNIGLRAGLTDSIYMKLIDTRVEDYLKRNAECGECEYRLRCAGGCRASALGTDPTDIMGPDRAACLLFRGGYIPRIMDAVREAQLQLSPNADG
jgi:radical SAM protein with 4Fe4S-binding SPASM domain